jgi:hypothetical protein
MSVLVAISIFSHHFLISSNFFIHSQVNKLSLKGKTVNILGFSGHIVSIVTTLFCLCRMKAAIYKLICLPNKYGCIPIKLDLQK